MDYLKVYNEWLNDDSYDEETKKELESIKNNDEEIKDRFYKSLEFGTAGLRGKIGAGTNRMNKYNIMKTTQALADTIKNYGEKAMQRGVTISYDVRKFSKEFAEISANVLASNGIKVYLSDDIRPTPLLSYSIRKFNCISGIMITASHNPKEYNGYKAYWEEGSQILEDKADEILNNLSKIESFTEVKIGDFEKLLNEGKIEYFGENLDKDYFEDVLSLTINDDNIDKNVKIVYTPLNGTGNKFVRHILDVRGFKNVYVVKEQENPDSNFTTVPYPNPENPEAFEYAINLGKEVGADLLLATDPDADRTAVEVLHNGEYVFLDGNKIGALLTNYILSQRFEKHDLPQNPVVVKSIVTGDLSTRIANKYNVDMIETLTGFKNVCGKANEYEKTGEKSWVFGYEESIGYSYGTFVRDKDAVSSSMMISEMLAYYKKLGKTLIDVLNDLYEEFGYHENSLTSVVMEGLDGQQKISRIMEEFRKNPIAQIENIKLIETKDYEIDFKKYSTPKSNVLKYYYDDGSWYALRPSGTEPKIKLYIYSVANTKENAVEKVSAIEKIAKEKMMNVK
ncbi:phospho-sugar mutase [uncultured Finegoldia sp.]|uniref:phospho-sugar mutase n=1 Tax=uncultured Finegoldia sp. TaxID=328009 RepID=UPI002616CDF5|nr:phospho-sugar mutase [uncultured Finegoldia sp.]